MSHHVDPAGLWVAIFFGSLGGVFLAAAIIKAWRSHDPNRKD